MLLQVRWERVESESTEEREARIQAYTRVNVNLLNRGRSGYIIFTSVNVTLQNLLNRERPGYIIFTRVNVTLQNLLNRERQGCIVHDEHARLAPETYSCTSPGSTLI